jgi:lysyl endopeptidase
MNRCRAVQAVLAVLLVATSAQADSRRKVGDERPYAAATPAQYPVGASHRPVSWTDTVASPGAEFVRVHFSRFDLPPGDFVRVSSLDGAQSWLYEGRGPQGTGEFWAFAVDGDTALVELHTGAGAAKGRGYRIDKLGHGTESLGGQKKGDYTDVVCGTDGREDAACHASTVNMNPIARLLFQSGGSMYVCTGWLVAGANANTMVTNNHCFDTQSETTTVQAKFGYQRSGCGSGTVGAGTDFAGGTFLKTNTERKKGSRGGLDYTIFTLLGNPEASWGEYTATSKAPSVGLVIDFPQHPGGNAKEIGWWEDGAHTVRCKVNTVNATYGGASSGSQMGYGCDSEGGSSGSPILDDATGRVIGLHHYGGVTSSPCLNSGTMMSKVCADAGSLLACASN